MPKLNVVLRKEDLDPSLMFDKVVVVIDVLFATSTIATVLHHGAEAVHPCSSCDVAVRAVAGLEKDSFLLAGEHNLKRIDGFAGYSPLALTSLPLRGKQLFFSTTNGTWALSKASCAERVYAAGLVNATAIAAQLLEHSDQTIVLLCAGSAGRVNLEDVFAAGYLIEQLEAAMPGNWQHSDTCQIARAVYRSYADAPERCLMESQLGQALAGSELEAEVRYAAQIGLFDVIPTAVGERLVCLKQQVLQRTGTVSPL